MLYLQTQAKRGIALIVCKSITQHRKSSSTDNPTTISFHHNHTHIQAYILC